MRIFRPAALTAFLLLLLPGTVAGQLVPSEPTTHDVIEYLIGVGCVPGFDYEVVRSGNLITIRQMEITDGGCRTVIGVDRVPIGRLPAGSYTLRIFYVDGTVRNVEFAVVSTSIPTLGDFALAAFAIALAVCGVLLSRSW